MSDERRVERLSFIGQLPKHRFKPGETTVAWEAELTGARTSLYYWWWRFLKESLAYRAARMGELRDEPWAGVARDFGHLYEDFDDWWYQTGRMLFAEQASVPRVRVLEDREQISYELSNASLFLEIPLTIKRRTILRQLNRLLDANHPGQSLRVYSHSTARRRVYPHQRIRLTTFPTLLAVWDAHRAHPDKPAWAIGEELNLSPIHVAQPEDEASDVKYKHRMMSLTVQRLQRKAMSLIDFAARGEFPRFK